MKRSLVLALALLTSCAFAADSKAADEQALRDLHSRDREAHLKGNPALLAQTMAAEFVDVGRGRFERVTRDQFRERFTKVFQTNKYSRWEDMAPPVVHITPDGKTGWMAVKVGATITSQQEGKAPETMDFQSAWLANYEKQNGKWLMVAISYSVPEGK